MITALYPGSFDPVTLGHIDIIESAVQIFDKVVVGVAYNMEKRGLIPCEQRIKLIKDSVKNIPNIEVVSYDGLTTDYAEKINAGVIIRGLRNSVDFEYEMEMSGINSKLNNNIKTVLLFSKPDFRCVSSSAVREIIAHKGNLSGFVPSAVEKYLLKNYY